MRYRANSPFSALGKTIYAVFSVLLAFGFLFSVVANAPSESKDTLWYRADLHHYDEDDQYARLADSILNGEISLDLPVPDELKELENPYDPLARYDIGSEDVPIYWDHAYRHGKYYSYFGVVPAVLIYLPYEVITGSWMPTPSAVALIGILTIAAMSLFTRRFVLLYFEQTATTTSLLLCLFMLFAGSNVVSLGFLSRFYSVPTLSAQFFTFMGLWFWLGAQGKGRESEPKTHPTARNPSNRTRCQEVICSSDRSAWRLRLDAGPSSSSPAFSPSQYSKMIYSEAVRSFPSKA